MKLPLVSSTAAAIAISLAVLSASPTVAHAAGVDPTTANPQQLQRAQSHFELGRGYLIQKKLDKAIEEFRAAHEIVASPNARFSIARALRDGGKLDEAYAEYGRAIGEASALAGKDPRYQQTADAAASERSELEPKLGLLSLSIVHASPDTTLKLGDRDVPQSEWNDTVAVMPGHVDAVLTSGGKEVARAPIDVAAGEKKTVNLDALPPPPAPPVAATPPPVPTGPIDNSDSPFAASTTKPTPPPAADKLPPPKLRPYAYVAGGVAAAGFLTFAIFGSMEKSTFSDLQTKCNNGPCGPDHADDISSGRTQQTVANIGLVVGVVGLAAGVTLFVISMPKKSVATATTATTTASPSANQTPRAAIVASPSFIGIRGSL